MVLLKIFKKQFLLTHVSGIPVLLDSRWFFVLALISWITANNINSLVHDYTVSLVLGLTTTLVFFFSIFLHEYAHAIAARRERVQVLEIVLHPFGGLARFAHEPDTPRAEFRIAIAGPAASFLISLVFAGLTAIANALGLDILAPLFLLLALLNFTLAAFNLFPGYPLDGGRVLRAILWHRGKDLNEATILTGRCGQLIAVALVVFGIVAAFSLRDLLTGFWTILVGIFLFDAARGIINETNGVERLPVESVMQIPVAVEPETDVQQFVDRILNLHRQSVFPVAKDKQFYGVLMLEDLKKLPADKWRETTVAAIMRPVTPNFFVETDTLLPEARQLMRVNGISALGVIDKNGHLVGFMRRGKIVRSS